MKKNYFTPKYSYFNFSQNFNCNFDNSNRMPYNWTNSNRKQLQNNFKYFISRNSIYDRNLLDTDIK